jgi:hypothetical protein
MSGAGPPYRSVLARQFSHITGTVPKVLVGGCKVGDLAWHSCLLLNPSGPVDEFGVDIEGVWVLGAKDVLIHGE